MSMTTGRPLQQQQSNVRVVRRSQWSKAVAQGPVKKKRNGEEEHDQEDKAAAVVMPLPILKKISSFDAIQVSDPPPPPQEIENGALDYQSPLGNDGLIMDPPTSMFFNFTYGLYSDSGAATATAIAATTTGTPNGLHSVSSNGNGRILVDEESSSSCSSSVEDPSPPPWNAIAAVAVAVTSKKKKKVTFAVPEAVTFAEKEAAPPPSPRVRSPRASPLSARNSGAIQSGWKRPSAAKAARVAPEGLLDLTASTNDKKRCSWITTQSDPAYIEYHDSEWGVPVHDDKKLFELLVFAGAQAELSWSALLSKREHYRTAFAGFDAEIVSKFDEAKISSLAGDREILQHEGKLRQIVDNAKCVVEVVQEFGSLDKFLWNFLSHKPIVNRYRTPQQVPIKSAKSDLMSRDLMKRGFRFVGPTIMYSFMQAAGMTNDHILPCFRHEECVALSSPSSSSSQQSGTTSPSPPSSKDRHQIDEETQSPIAQNRIHAKESSRSSFL